MKKIQPFFHNILVLFLLLILGVVLVLFLNNRVAWPTQEPQTASTQLSFQSPIKKATLVAPTATLTPTRTPVIIPVIITRFPTPTPAPSPTPTPTFEPLSDKPIGGYIFSPPELISSRDYIEIVDWLPGSSEELIVTNFEGDQFLIELFNIKSGKRERVVETPLTIVGKPVWLTETRQMSYLAQDKSGEIDLYLSNNDKQRTSKLVQRNVNPPLALAPDRRSLLIWDKQMSQLRKTGQQAELSQEKITLNQPLPIVSGGPSARYQAAWNNTNWIAYYNSEKFILVNSQTGKTRDISLGVTKRFWPLYMVWSSDGQKLAMVVTSNSPEQNIAFTQLAIFNPTTDEMQLIEGNFAYVNNVVWAPDNRHTLISAVIKQLNGYNVEALFLVDTKTQQVDPVSVMPQNALGFSPFSSLAWSLDGKQILSGYAIKPGQSGWYRVTVKTP